MRIRPPSFCALGLFLAALVTAWARAEEPATAPTDKQPAGESAKGPSPAADAQAPDGLRRLDPVAPAWIDLKRKRVVMVGKVCLREGSLEMFACPEGTKEHESVLSVPVRPFIVHAALLRVGAEPGNPTQWYPKFEPARGTPIEVTIFWSDEQGRRQRARAQDWVRQAKTGKSLEQSWVFGGSRLNADQQTGAKTYLADFGEFICISNFPGAMLDVPVESSNKASDLLFEAFTERIPPLGTKVTLVLTPKPENGAKEAPKNKATEE